MKSTTFNAQVYRNLSKLIFLHEVYKSWNTLRSVRNLNGLCVFCQLVVVRPLCKYSGKHTSPSSKILRIPWVVPTPNFNAHSTLKFCPIVIANLWIARFIAITHTQHAKRLTGRLNINTYTYKNKHLKNRKLKRKRKQKRKRGSLREGREAPPRRCPHPFRFCFRFRFNFWFFNFLFLYVYVLIFNHPVA